MKKRRFIKKMVAMLSAAVVAVGTMGAVPVEASEEPIPTIDRSEWIEVGTPEYDEWLLNNHDEWLYQTMRNLDETFTIENHVFQLPKCTGASEVVVEYGKYVLNENQSFTNERHPDWVEEAKALFKEALWENREYLKLRDYSRFDTWYTPEGDIYFRVNLEGIDPVYVEENLKPYAEENCELIFHDTSRVVFTDDYMDLLIMPKDDVEVMSGVTIFMGFSVDCYRISRDEMSRLDKETQYSWYDHRQDYYPKIDMEGRERQYGDSDFDGKVDANDALNVLKNVVALNKLPLNDQAACDLNHDGSTDAADALGILRTVVGLQEAVIIE